MGFGFRIIVEGNYACFTRPEMKVERVSYDVPTPSSLEGLIKSVYWKPAIRYIIDKIIVFNPIEFANIRRNEVKEKVSLSKVKSQLAKKNGVPSIVTSECRSQRAAMVLTNVKYGVEFHFEMTGHCSENEGSDAEKKHYNILKRRLEKGQFFRVPCLGCSEFIASRVIPVESFELELISQEIREQEDVDLGFMLYGLRFEDEGVPTNQDWDNPKFSDKADAVYYRPHLIRGVIDVEKYRGELKC